MASAELIVQRYAQALHALATGSGLHEQVEAQLTDLDTMLADNVDLRRQLDDPRLGRQAKKAVLRQLLGDACCDVLRNTVLLMTDKGRAGLLPVLRGAYDRIAMAAAGRAVAHVQTAAPLDDATRSRLLEQLAAATGKSISIRETVDESLIGGLRVIIGSRMIDGSLKRRLESIQDKLLAVPLEPAS